MNMQYRILSASEIQSDPQAIYMVQSDASGDDGYGYYHSYYSEASMQYFSAKWMETHMHSSHAMELYALLIYLRQHDTTICNIILVWITDSTSAALTINKGSCANPEGFGLLKEIYEISDKYHLELLALWVPREENRLADYLSHLASIINRESSQGCLERLQQELHQNGTGGSI